MNKKALVFGINGMDARTITFILLSKGYEVVGTFRRNTLNVSDEIHKLYGFDPRLSFEYCDINDFASCKRVIEKHSDVTEIYMLAWQSHVGISFLSPDISKENGQSVYNILENVKNFAPKAKTYFAATSELFGGDNPEKPYNEESPFDCRSPYSLAKEVGVRWVKYYRQLGLFVCYGILFNHSNQFRSKDFFIRRATNSAARICAGKQKDVSFGFLGFSRDEHWSDFGCEMMWRMLQNESPKDYVIATGETHHGEEFLDLAFGYFNLDWKKYVKIDQSRFRPNEVVKLIGDSSKAQKELGWNPKRMPFKDHIELMAQYDYDIEVGRDPKRPDVFKMYP